MEAFKARWGFSRFYKKVAESECRVDFGLEDSLSGGKRLRKEER